MGDCIKFIFYLRIIINLGQIFLLVGHIGKTRLLLINVVLKLSRRMKVGLVLVYEWRQDELINDRGVMMVLMMLLVKDIPYVHVSLHFSFFILLLNVFFIFVFLFLLLRIILLSRAFLFIYDLSIFAFIQIV